MDIAEIDREFKVHFKMQSTEWLERERPTWQSIGDSALFIVRIKLGPVCFPVIPFSS